MAVLLSVGIVLNGLRDASRKMRNKHDERVTASLIHNYTLTAHNSQEGLSAWACVPLTLLCKKYLTMASPRVMPVLSVDLLCPFFALFFTDTHYTG